MKCVFPVALLVGWVVKDTAGGWVDVDTPLDKRTTRSLVDGKTYDLVMSDEFNVENRTFKDGHDSMWTALDKSDDDASSAGGGSLQFYNSSAITTENGMLKISTYREKTNWRHYDPVKKTWKDVQTNFTSGMLQSWNKFCFTGGIVEVDVILPGSPFVGGLWPAIWMLGNLGRATYEASTNNIWPWSFDVCDRDLQRAQAISACDNSAHYGLHKNQGRGATEIDILEVMAGDPSNGPFEVTEPLISVPYADFTLQAAPGVPENRPQSGSLPLRKDIRTKSGYTKFFKQTWYEGLEMEGNTSINPFFYGTYLAATKPNEPVTRTKEQAFQADAIGAIHQLTPAHFQTPHTFRLEWQPGRGGRLDWFVKTYITDRNASVEGDGSGDEWVRAFTIFDESLDNLMKSNIPNEPSYLIMNTAISSTWGFPYDVPDYCVKCFDCSNPKCDCAMNPGFCQMLRGDGVAMYIDSIRVYQDSENPNHTIGCDPPAYPTKDYIEGHAYRYMRNQPFSYEDRGLPLQKVQRGGGSCQSDLDCGGHVESMNLTAIHQANSTERDYTIKGRGRCVSRLEDGMFLTLAKKGRVCQCDFAFTGPHCLSLAHIDNSPSAHKLNSPGSPFAEVATVSLSPFLIGFLFAMAIALLVMVNLAVREKRQGNLRPDSWR